MSRTIQLRNTRQFEQPHMHNSNPKYRRLPRQRGAALVVGLILLVIVTLLAIGGMNTAALELIMSGNEQYRQKAFEAARSRYRSRAHQGRHDRPGRQGSRGQRRRSRRSVR